MSESSKINTIGANELRQLCKTLESMSTVDLCHVLGAASNEFMNRAQCHTGVMSSPYIAVAFARGTHMEDLKKAFHSVAQGKSQELNCKELDS